MNIQFNHKKSLDLTFLYQLNYTFEQIKTKVSKNIFQLNVS